MAVMFIMHERMSKHAPFHSVGETKGGAGINTGDRDRLQQFGTSSESPHEVERKRTATPLDLTDEPAVENFFANLVSSITRFHRWRSASFVQPRNHKSPTGETSLYIAQRWPPSNTEAGIFERVPKALAAAFLQPRCKSPLVSQNAYMPAASSTDCDVSKW
jgi:hypothetical protein